MGNAEKASLKPLFDVPFYCRHGQEDIRFKPTKIKILNEAAKDQVLTITFECPRCHKEIIFKTELSAVAALTSSLLSSLSPGSGASAA